MYKIRKVHDTQNKNLHNKTVYFHFSPNPTLKTEIMFTPIQYATCWLGISIKKP